ncbi:XRE family transcriptional regulator [Lentzea sp. NBRC 105346]|uniref:helix-turn-helix domain-containing protein n=1 Tax=Lentzea sp. NBRC 105346 TaxID=3032205 RepID=UPI0024A11B02|nr:XRE family transcriptional regulator [Lentzea sp. NBRC 105346]GLZ28083.1 XRE family transcriptional regulator [Lentzea sp. NBRC 105346]
MPNEPNDLLRTARESAGLTQGQLAELANAQVERDTGKLGAMDDDYVGKLERGVHRWPNRHYRSALRATLRVSSDAALGFYSTRHRAVTVGSSPRQVNGGDEVERKAFLRVLAGSVAGLAFSDPLSVFAASAAGTAGSRRVGLTDVEQIRHVARMYANQDHLFGGGLAAQAVVTQLSASTELLEGRFAKDTTRTALFSAVADLADTAAGMCFDAGLHQQAERCFRFAVGCATEAGDWALRAKALSGLSNLAVHQERHDDALSYSEMALVRTDRLTPVVRAVMHTRHARALGAMGTPRERDCLAAVHRAEDCFADRVVDEPDWISYYSQARLERDVGRALLGLALNGGDHLEAQRRLSAAVQTFPKQHSRGKALAIVNLAVLTMARDDPAHASQLGHDAVTSAGPVRSDRVLEAFRQLRNQSQAHHDLPAVRDLDQRISQLLQTPGL